MRLPLRVLSWCVMPNYWHLMLWPQADDDVSHFYGLAVAGRTRNAVGESA